MTNLPFDEGFGSGARVYARRVGALAALVVTAGSLTLVGLALGRMGLEPLGVVVVAVGDFVAVVMLVPRVVSPDREERYRDRRWARRARRMNRQMPTAMATRRRISQAMDESRSVRLDLVAPRGLHWRRQHAVVEGVVMSPSTKAQAPWGGQEHAVLLVIDGREVLIPYRLIERVILSAPIQRGSMLRPRPGREDDPVVIDLRERSEPNLVRHWP